MRKFKHTKLGIEASWNTKNEMYETWINNQTIQYLSKELIESSNDWEELVQVIMEVERKKDGVVFKIGEQVKSNGDTLTIKYFTHNGAYVHFKEVDEHDSTDNLVKLKEEPSYLITAFRFYSEEDSERTIFQLQSNGLYNDGSKGIFNLDEIMKGRISVEDNACEIYSVKNSKGEEFVLSETVELSHVRSAITKFELLLNDIDVVLRNGDRYSLESVSKVKSPIYTTTDGVDIYEGDKLNIWLLNKDLIPSVKDRVSVGNFCNQDKEVADRYLTFTSEENRDKYIKENSNKPIFVSADGVEYFNEFDYSINLFSIYIENWTENRLPIPRAIKENGWIHFSTEEARQEYIDFNKPRFSLADIENCYPHANITGNRIKDISVVATLFSNLKKLGK